MACPTCGNTPPVLISEASDLAPDGFWCSRCGTVYQDHANGDRVVMAPKIIERCRTYQRRCLSPHSPIESTAEEQVTLWRQLGIAESINLPENRPQ